MRRFCLALLVCLWLSGCLLTVAETAPMTVDGLTDGITAAFNGSPVIRVTVPQDATALTVAGERIALPDGTAVREGDETGEWCEYFDRYRLTPCVAFDGMRFNMQGIWRVTASVTADEYPDGADPETMQWTELAALDVTVGGYAGTLDAPQLTLSGTAVRQGEWLRATLSAFQHKDEWYWYELALMDPVSGEWGEWFTHRDVTLKAGLADSFAIPTSDLTPGTYRLYFRTEAVGWEDNGTYKDFTVTPAVSLSDGIALSDSAVPVGVPVTVALRAAGAERLTVSVAMEEDPMWQYDPFTLWGEAGLWRPDFDRAGTFHLTLTARRDGGDSVVDTAVLTVTAPDGGRLSDPVFSGFPGLLLPGRDLTGALYMDERTERCYTELCYCPDDGDWETLYRGNVPADGAAEALSLPASLFTQAGRYRLHAHTYAAGLTGSWKEFWFVRAAAASSGVTLRVNGGLEDVTVDSHAPIRIEVTAPQATAVRVLVGDRWEYMDDSACFALNEMLDGGEYAIVAQITTDEAVWRAEGFDWGGFRWEELHWGACGAPVTVHALSPNGRLSQPQVSLSTSQAARGEWVLVSVADQGRNESYWAQVYRDLTDEDGMRRLDRVMDCYQNGANVFAVPTAVLEPGQYSVIVHAGAVGYDSASAGASFAVTGSAQPLPAVGLYFPADTAVTSRDIGFCAYAEGADLITVDVSRAGAPGWSVHYEDDDGVNTWSFGTSDSGVYTFALKAWHEGELMGEDSFVLSVQAPAGALAVPQTDLPAIHPAGADLDLDLTVDENTDRIDVRLICCADDGPWEMLYEDTWLSDGTGTAALRIPARYLSRPGVCRLELHLTAEGYEGAHFFRHFLVTDTAVTQGLTLTVGADEILLHGMVPITLSAPQGVTAARLWSSDVDRWDVRADAGQGFSWERGFHTEGPVTLAAQATTDQSVSAWLRENGDMDGFDWSGVSWSLLCSPLTVEVIKLGDLNTPQVTFPDGTLVGRGRFLTLTLSPVADAYSYGVQVRRAEGDDGWLIDMDYPLTEAATIGVPTDGLDEGSYVLGVDARRYGWHGELTEYPFTVTGDSQWTGEAVFRVDRAALLTREWITYSVYAPGAEEVMVCNGGPDNIWDRRWGESVTDHVMLNWVKPYALTAYARYPGRDDWRQVGETASVTVTAPYGAVGLTVEAPGSVPAGEALTVGLTCDLRDAGGTAECWLQDVNGRYFELDLADEAQTADGKTRFTYALQADTLPCGAYRLYACAIPDTPGYEPAAYERVIDVTGGALEAALTVSPNSAQLFDEVSMLLDVPGATAVALYSDVNDMGWRYALGGFIGGSETAWTEGEYLVSGLYTTAPIDPTAEGFSWETVPWEGTAASVTLVIEPPALALEDLRVTLDSATVRRGEALVLTVLNDDPGFPVSYGATLRPMDPDAQGAAFPWYGTDSPDGRTIRIETLYAEPGEYQLLVSANARSCYPRTALLPVTVTEAADGARLAAPDTALTGVTINVAGYAKGASHIRLDVSYDMGAPGPVREETDGDCLIAEVFAGERPDTVRLSLTATYPDGTEENVQRTVTVTAPNGPVHPVVTLNGPFNAGRDLDFTVTVEEDAYYTVLVKRLDAEEPLFARSVPEGASVRRFCLKRDQYALLPDAACEIRVIAAGRGYAGRETVFLLDRDAALATLTLPRGLKTVGAEAFSGVAAQKIVVPPGVTAIASKAFDHCPELVELVLPEGVTVLARDALGDSGPVYIYGAQGSCQETYAANVDGLYFVPVE